MYHPTRLAFRVSRIDEVALLHPIEAFLEPSTIWLCQPEAERCLAVEVSLLTVSDLVIFRE